jgi:hypothetical protein
MFNVLPRQEVMFLLRELSVYCCLFGTRQWKHIWLLARKDSASIVRYRARVHGDTERIARAGEESVQHPCHD